MWEDNLCSRLLRSSIALHLFLVEEEKEPSDMMLWDLHAVTQRTLLSTYFANIRISSPDIPFIFFYIPVWICSSHVFGFLIMLVWMLRIICLLVLFTFLFWFNIAVHCIWCHVQFSPTSEHILLAYGRRHVSLLKSIVIDGETKSPIYTVLEV
jgi:hypothetical protein